ncbi:MAG: hypothetical protein AB1558_08305 [Thermodesulfobacteriota bacterium]
MVTQARKGHYAAKHAPDGQPDGRIAARVRLRADAEQLSCTAAERIAAELGVTMAAVGRTLDLLEVRITCCQIGLFGCPPSGKIVRPEAAGPELQKAIGTHLSEGRLSCAEVWRIAAGMELPRLKVASACEALEIRIKPCQLGAF